MYFTWRFGVVPYFWRYFILFTPMHLADSFAMVSGMIKNAVVAVVFLGGGIYLAVNKEKWQDFFEKEN